MQFLTVYNEKLKDHATSALGAYGSFDGRLARQLSPPLSDVRRPALPEPAALTTQLLT